MYNVGHCVVLNYGSSWSRRAVFLRPKPIFERHLFSLLQTHCSLVCQWHGLGLSNRIVIIAAGNCTYQGYVSVPIHLCCNCYLSWHATFRVSPIKKWLKRSILFPHISYQKVRCISNPHLVGTFHMGLDYMALTNRKTSFTKLPPFFGFWSFK